MDPALQEKIVKLWKDQHTIAHIVEQTRVSPMTIGKYVLLSFFPNQTQNWKDAQKAFDNLQDEGDTHFEQDQ